MVSSMLKMFNKNGFLRTNILKMDLHRNLYVLKTANIVANRRGRRGLENGQIAAANSFRGGQ